MFPNALRNNNVEQFKTMKLSSKSACSRQGLSNTFRNTNAKLLKIWHCLHNRVPSHKSIKNFPNLSSWHSPGPALKPFKTVKWSNKLAFKALEGAARVLKGCTTFKGIPCATHDLGQLCLPRSFHKASAKLPRER